MKRRRVAGLVSSIASVGAMMLMWTPASQASGDVIHVIQFTGSQLCLSLNPANFGKDVQVVQEECDFGTEQQWRFIPDGNDGPFNVYQVQNVATGMCLRATSNRDFSVVDTIDCTGISNEKWALEFGLTLSSEISSGGHPNLDNFENRPNPGNPIDVFHPNDGGAQTFTFHLSL